MADCCCIVCAGGSATTCGIFVCLSVFTRTGDTTTGGVAEGRLCALGGIGVGTGVVGVFNTGLAIEVEVCIARFEIVVPLVGSIL